MNKSSKNGEKHRGAFAVGAIKKLARRLVRVRTGQGVGAKVKGPHTVSVVGCGEVVVGDGESLLGGMLREGMQINHFCGGNGSCGTCRVEVEDGLSNLARATTAEVVAGAASEPRKRLACQMRINGPVTVRVRM